MRSGLVTEEVVAPTGPFALASGTAGRNPQAVGADPGQQMAAGLPDTADTVDRIEINDDGG